ncbi:MAG: hypothetical protein AABW85_03715 [archaeon]
MGIVGNFIESVKKAIPILVQKVATTLLVVFFLGSLFGAFVIATKGIFALIGLPLVIIAMYYKLDEGFLLLTLYFLYVFWF